jgi:hypothetical protein
MISFLFCLLLFPFSLAVCPGKSIKWQTKCYYFENTNSPFITAEIFCNNNLGGNLASVHNGFTNAFMAQQARLSLNGTDSPDFWVGITNLINPGNWSWTDGSVYDFSEWRNINKLTVTDGQGCGAIAVSSGLWNADDCFISKPFVCETNETYSTLPSSTTTLLTSTSIVSTTNSLPCPSGWAYYASSSSCFRQTDSWHNFTDAEQECANKNAHLASIHSADEFSFVQQVIPNDYFRIGLHSDDNKVTWKWTDKTPVDFTPWDVEDGNPESGSNCVMAGFGIFENNNGCVNPWTGLCKKPAFA